MQNVSKMACLWMLAGCCISTAHAETIEHAPITVMPPSNQTKQAASATPPAPQAALGKVSRSTFTSSILAREPIDTLNQIPAGQKVHYFTELSELQGHIVTHQWERDGVFQLGLQFPVGGPRWRVHSTKTIGPNMVGTWTVTVKTNDGLILLKDQLVVTDAEIRPLTQPSLLPNTNNTTKQPTTPAVTNKPASPASPTAPPATMPDKPMPTTEEVSSPSSTTSDKATKTRPSDAEPSDKSSPESVEKATETNKQPIWETLR